MAGLQTVPFLHQMNESGNIYQPKKVEKTSGVERPLRLDEAALIKLMHCLEMTRHNACTCDEAFALLDEYVELVASGEPVIPLMPLVKNHMDICHLCQEEYQALLHILKTEMSEINGG